IRLEMSPGEATQQVWFREVRLWEEEPQPWWEHYPGLMALYPLCRHGQEVADAVTHAASAIRRRELDSYRRADLLTSLAFFGILRDRSLDVLSLIGREQMKESPFYQVLLTEGEQIGVRNSVLQALRVRFGDEAALEFEETVNRIANLDQLQALHKLAIQS